MSQEDDYYHLPQFSICSVPSAAWLQPHAHPCFLSLPSLSFIFVSSEPSAYASHPTLCLLVTGPSLPILSPVSTFPHMPCNTTRPLPPSLITRVTLCLYIVTPVVRDQEPIQLGTNSLPNRRAFFHFLPVSARLSLKCTPPTLTTSLKRFSVLPLSPSAFGLPSPFNALWSFFCTSF